ncbi:hypothetical protein HMPREF0322_05028, partial [Desulfitobacterium hafniense DP7]
MHSFSGWLDDLERPLLNTKVLSYLATVSFTNIVFFYAQIRYANTPEKAQGFCFLHKRSEFKRVETKLREKHAA